MQSKNMDENKEYMMLCLMSFARGHADKCKKKNLPKMWFNVFEHSKEEKKIIWSLLGHTLINTSSDEQQFMTYYNV